VNPTVERQRAEAERVTDPRVWAYVDGGSGDETTLDGASDAWRQVRFRPRALVDVSTVDTATSVLGMPLPAPILVAPTASQEFLHPLGEVATARGAAAAGSLMTVSTRASKRFEDIAAELPGGWWFQAYVTRDRPLIEAAVARAVAAGATAIVLTGDTPYVGAKRRAADFASLDGLWRERNLGPGDRDQDPSITEAEIGLLAGLSGLPVLVKGVLRADDARRFADAGAAGIVVSNHGGRQLDRAVSTAVALPEVAAAVDLPVLVDGGIRSGLDVLAALALGADAVLLGRPVLWALASGGADGVRDLLDALRTDLAHVMALAGAPTVARVTDDLVVSPLR
jgi:4-hydroxymandelate oxidase